MHIRELESAVLGELERLAADGFGYRLHHPPDAQLDIFAEIRRDGDEWTPIAVAVCRNPRRGPVREVAHRVRRIAEPLGALPAVGLPRVGPGLKELLRELEVGYVGADGQVFLKGPGILIDRQVLGAQRKVPWDQSSNPFADKSSLLLRYLFSQPSEPLRVVDLSEALGISPGLVSRLGASLRSDGHLIEENGLMRLADREVLLEDWQDFYRRRAKRQREERCYLHARDSGAVMRKLAALSGEEGLPRWGLSFHAGASLVTPYAFFSEVHILVDPMSWGQVSAFGRRLGLEPAQREANVVLVQPYYKHSWRYGLREIGPLPVVSDLQLFLDLSVYPRRGAEQAARIRERILAA